MSLLYLHQLSEADLRSAGAAVRGDGRCLSFLVHPWYLGVTERDAVRRIDAIRSHIGNCTGDYEYTTTVEQEAAHYVGYLERMAAKVRSLTARYGILVEEHGRENAALALLAQIQPSIQWLVIPTGDDTASRLEMGLNWSKIVPTLVMLEIRSAVVWGANDRDDSACVPTVCRELCRAGIAAEINHAASFAYLGRAGRAK